MEVDERALSNHRETDLAWRRERIRDAGFGSREATRIADDSRFDLHELISLVERGCRPDLAARILAPLERS